MSEVIILCCDIAEKIASPSIRGGALGVDVI